MSANKPKTDKQREQERCGGCDCFETTEGCECRRIPCCRCGTLDNIFNMNHPEFHSDYWFNGMDFETKLSEVYCNDCINHEGENEEGDY